MGSISLTQSIRGCGHTYGYTSRHTQTAEDKGKHIHHLKPRTFKGMIWARILVQVTIYRRLRIGRDGHLDQSEAYDIS